MTATKVLDARGLKCPQPQLKVFMESRSMNKGDILEVVADCPTFDADIRHWCERSKKALLWMRSDGAGKRCQVQM
jgi:tRNA 2-thiouridine synthesizing protein A